MSRTDVHRPYYVQELDYTQRRWFTEIHDHLNGICDLPLPPHHPGWDKGQCHLVYIWHKNIYCGCRLCTGYYDRKADRRSSRARARQECRKARTTRDYRDEM